MSFSIEYAAIAKCTPEHVWQVFENIELWSRWDPEAIREVRWVSGEPWTKGAKFSIEMLKPMSFKLTPEVLDATPPFYVHFRGQGSGVTGEQHYIFRWMPEQQATELRTLQEFSGAPIMFFGDKIKSSLEKGIAHLFARVIEEAENLARSEALPAPAPAAGSEALPAPAPAAGSEALPAPAPAAGSEALPAPAPAAGSEALPAPAPAAGSEALPAPAPAAGSEALPAPAPAAGSEALPAPAPAAGSEALPAPAPAAGSEALPAPAPAAGSEALPAPAPAAGSEALPAPAPAAGSEALPAPAPAAGSEALPAPAPAAGSEALPAPAPAAGSEALPAPAPSIPDIGSGITNASMVIPGLHACLHESLGIVFDHLAAVPPELWTKELEGFGQPSVRDQIAHILGAESRWIRRLQLLPLETPDVASLTSVEAVRNLQKDVKASTITYLDSLPESKLYLPLERYPESWIGPPRSPAYILLHVITHGFHHKGQLVAMLRLLGHPAPDTDIQRS